MDRGRLAAALRDEEALFAERHPRSRELFEEAKGSLLAGVPMPWMTEWAGPHPVFAETAEGARFTDVDGNEFVDFCLGDTGAMTGHAPAATVAAIAAQAAKGITLMLPTADSSWVGEELERRFGLPYWQFALTATDANRFTIRLARAITGRPKVLVYSWCYHGTVDETFAVSEGGETALAPRQHRAPGRPGADDGRGRVERRRGARGGAGRRRDRLRPGRAGDDQHRDRPPGPRLPRGAARAHRRARNVAGNRRDPHDLRRPRRLHRRQRARAGLPHDRQADRGRGPGRGLRDEPRGGRARARPRRMRWRSPTSAASAARSRATRSRWRRCGRPWRAC